MQLDSESSSWFPAKKLFFFSALYDDRINSSLLATPQQRNQSEQQQMCKSSKYDFLPLTTEAQSYSKLRYMSERKLQMCDVTFGKDSKEN
ncbi:uncharacterized protein V6R79_006433 [Siganus canaliculatus]